MFIQDNEDGTVTMSKEDIRQIIFESVDFGREFYDYSKDLYGYDEHDQDMVDSFHNNIGRLFGIDKDAWI